MPLRPDKTGVRLAVRVTPKSSRDRIAGPIADSDGNLAIGVHVRAVPEKGKANDAVIKLLAKETGLARSLMTVISGSQSRHKVIHIEGEPAALEAELSRWLAKRGEEDT